MGRELNLSINIAISSTNIPLSAFELIKQKIISSLEKLYVADITLFNRNEGRGVSERCLVFRFAHYLQTEFPNYFVDCDFNSSFIGTTQQSGKPIQNPDGTFTKRFIDIIVHQRNFNSGSGIYNDFICFELKKWNNKKQSELEKDYNNLSVLTTDYGYKYGFHIILGKSIETSIITVYGGRNEPSTLNWSNFINEN